jgi:hypothetical protein
MPNVNLVPTRSKLQVAQDRSVVSNPDQSVSGSRIATTVSGVPVGTGGVLHISPWKLKRHPLLEHFPPIGKDDKKRLVADVKERQQVLVPILVYGDYYVIDGWNRGEAACEAHLPTVPVVFVDGKIDPLEAALSTRIARGQLTKSGVTVMLYLTQQSVFDNAEKRQKAGEEDADSFKQWAVRYRIPRKYFSNLIAIKKANPRKWEQNKADILAGLKHIPKLAAALNGAEKGGAKLKDGSPRGTEEHRFNLLKKSIAVDMPNRLKDWSDLTPEHREKVINGLYKWPGFFVKILEKELPKMLKEARNSNRGAASAVIDIESTIVKQNDQ